MKNILIAFVFAFTSSGFATELDRPRAVSDDQLAKAQDLPQTVIIRTSRNEPGKVEIVQLKEKLAKGQRVAGVKFEQMALNVAPPQLPYTSANELDMRSSKESWAFGLGLLGLGVGLAASSVFSSRAYASPYYNSGYYGSSYYASSYYPASHYAPTYTYGGYSYPYSSYDNYSYRGYDYSMCNWQQQAWNSQGY